MTSQSQLEKYYRKFAKNLHALIPEGVYTINLALLHHFDLLHFQPGHSDASQSVFTEQFHAIETDNKLTLFNDQFLIWITPGEELNNPYTCALIALNRGKCEPQLEAAFIATGIYNSSPIILQVLEKFLKEIQETEKTLSELEKAG